MYVHKFGDDIYNGGKYLNWTVIHLSFICE
jgi:hypothetical protein